MTDCVGYQCRQGYQLTPGAQTETAQTMMLGVSAMGGKGSGYAKREGADEMLGTPVSVGASKTREEKSPTITLHL